MFGKSQTLLAICEKSTGRFLNIVYCDPNVSKSHRLQVDGFNFFSSSLRCIMHKLGKILQVQNSISCTFVAEGTIDKILHLQNSARFLLGECGRG